MHLRLLAFLVMIGGPVAFADDDSSTETNEIIPREAIQKLDYSVRQALLRAIDKLEQAEQEAEQASQEAAVEGSVLDQSAGSLDAAPPTVKPLPGAAGAADASGDSRELLEESTNAVEVVPTVQFFTATFDEKNAQEQLLSSFIDRSKSWRRRATAVSRPAVHADGRSTAVQANEISTDAHNDDVEFEIRSKQHLPQQVSSTATPVTAYRSTTIRPRTGRRRTTSTTTTTTTTTPRPTHNEDGENIEVVDKKDIRILEAPLVTAFTLDLDERGSAKMVIPILQNTDKKAAFPASLPAFDPLAGPTIAKLNVRPSGPFEPSILPTPPPSSAAQSGAVSLLSPTTASTFVNQALFGPLLTKQASQLTSRSNEPTTNINSYFVERQRQLEQQIHQLKLQAQQQQDLILRQLQLLEQQAKLSNVPHLAATQSNALPSAGQQYQETPAFTIRPSVEFTTNAISEQQQQQQQPAIFPTFPHDQQLPLRDIAVRFQGDINHLPIQQQQLPVQNARQLTFENLQNPQQQQQQQQLASAGPHLVQIQPSNQLSFAPPFSPPTAAQQQLPELSPFQVPPQREYEDFRPAHLAFAPPFVGNSNNGPQQTHHINQLQQRSRLFRQEDGTSNFGLNQVQVQPSNTFSAILPRPQNLSNNNNNHINHNTNDHNDNNDNNNDNDTNHQQQEFENQNFYRQHLEPQLSSRLQQNAQLFYHQQQQQQQQQQKSTSGNSLRKNRNQIKSDNLTELKIISKVLALNHGINPFAPQNLRFGGGF